MGDAADQLGRAVAALAACAAAPQAPLLLLHRSAPAALLGRHQRAASELRADWCRRQGIALLRRPSGGGALYVDADQAGFSLILANVAGRDLLGWLEWGAAWLGRALAGLGVTAAFKFPNDLEIDGRKVASLFVARQGDAILLQGWLLVELDIARMQAALRVPTEKLSADGLAAARDRYAPLATLLDRRPAAAELGAALAAACSAALGIEFRPAADLPAPAALPPADAADAAGDALDGLWQTPAGFLNAAVALAADGERYAGVTFSGELRLYPADLAERLGEALAGQPVDASAAVLAATLGADTDLGGAALADFQRALTLALDKHRLGRRLQLDPARANNVMLHLTDSVTSVEQLLDQADTLLVPYCAKPAWCGWRHDEDCAACGRCGVSEAYRLGRALGLRVITILRYEHLSATLDQLRRAGSRAYLGMCCGSFFRKRQRAFRDAGLAALLMDIRGANCYELGEESAAYAGRFEALAEIDADLLVQVLRALPRFADTPSCGTIALSKT